MPEVMLQVIALSLENVISLVLAFPPRPAIAHNQDHIFCVQMGIGDEGVVIQPSAGVFPGDGDITPVDLQSILSATQRHLVDEAILVDFPKASGPLAGRKLLDQPIFGQKFDLFGVEWTRYGGQ